MQSSLLLITSVTELIHLVGGTTQGIVPKTPNNLQLPSLAVIKLLLEQKSVISAWVHMLWQSEQAFISLEVLLDCMRNRAGKRVLKAAMANTVDFNWKRL